jgi:serine/threonine protein kinase
MCSTNVGTPVYQAPEIGQENPYDGRCDSFSLGIILYEMCYRKKPFRTSGFNPLYEDKNKLKTQSIVLPVEPKINTLFSDIIKGTIVYDPERRMTIGDIYYKLQSEGGEILEASRIGNKAGQVDLQLPKGANGIRITNILSK